MFKIKPMRPKDFSFATELANTMDWNMAMEDFKFMTHLEPEGCFVLFDDSTPLGIATNISYGKVGWFGNLIVEAKYRHKGVGSLLVKHSVRYLQSKGVKTVGLYAYPNLVSFYSNFGFKPDEIFSLLHSKVLDSMKPGTLPKVETLQVRSIEALDRRCFGGNRKKLLESIILEKGNLSYYTSASTDVVGYVAATVYETMAWVGPLICQDGNVDTAVMLLKTVLAKLTGLNVYVGLPKKETALADMLSAVGFKEDFSVVRMFLGGAVAKNCIYLAESLERG
jgi:GNAT superfamily N-acetyltransferase